MKRNEFLCNHCGDCCKLILRLTQQDVDRIQSIGFNDFTSRNPFHEDDKRAYMKLIDDKCTFLKCDRSGKSKCMIYDHRPKGCREYPFNGTDEVDTCKPDDPGNLFKCKN